MGLVNFFLHGAIGSLNLASLLFSEHFLRPATDLNCLTLLDGLSQHRQKNFRQAQRPNLRPPPGGSDDRYPFSVDQLRAPTLWLSFIRPAEGWLFAQK
jgi:hypothetical protein